MVFRFVWPGKTKNGQLRALADDYLERLRHFVRCEITEVRAAGDVETTAGIELESKRISDRLRPGDFSVLLDSEGVERSSQDLADEITRWEKEGVKAMTFIVGGAGGVSANLRGRISSNWSLSRLTFTHEMARVLLLEQLYRAYTIARGLPYQK
jgi:23S rRNA (pseudouridine1915-N3)-methyltransferase